jgi:hypothetical protein
VDSPAHQTAAELNGSIAAVQLTAKQWFETFARGVVVFGGHGGLSVELRGLVWGKMIPTADLPASSIWYRATVNRAGVRSGMTEKVAVGSLCPGGQETK